MDICGAKCRIRPQTHSVADIQIREPVGENLNQTHNPHTQYPLQT
jgi:hypothetical protein